MCFLNDGAKLTWNTFLSQEEYSRRLNLNLIRLRLHIPVNFLINLSKPFFILIVSIKSRYHSPTHELILLLH